MKYVYYKGNMAKALEAQQEVELMQACKHRYIIEVIECAVDEKKLCIVMEYADDDDLETLIFKRKEANQPLTEEEVLTYFL